MANQKKTLNDYVIKGRAVSADLRIQILPIALMRTVPTLRYLFVAMDKTGVVGIAEVVEHADDPTLYRVTDLWVAPHVRRRMIGTRLVKTIESWAVKFRVDRLAAELPPAGDGETEEMLRRFWSSTGWEKVWGRRVWCKVLASGGGHTPADEAAPLKPEMAAAA